MQRFRGHALGVAALALLAMVMFVPAASAAPSQAPPPSTTLHTPRTGHAVHMKMTLDCVHMTPGARVYADQHRYCAGRSANPASAGTVTPAPDNVVTGTCGDSWLWIWDGQNGYTDFQFGVYSDLGSIMMLNYDVSWANWRNGFSGSIYDTVWPWDASWERTTFDYTAPGDISAIFSGTATLVWGGECVLNGATDSTTTT